MINYDALPKITCMMVTDENRLETLAISLRCFLDQTYPNKELLIVTDASDQYKSSIHNLVRDLPEVRLAFLKGKYTLGALRNIGVGLAFGDLFVQWDDDDFCAPERLMVQYSYLQKHPKAKLCFLGDQLHYYFPTRQLFWNNWEVHSGGWKKYGLIPGTIMAYTKDFPYRYPASGEHAAAGEDSVMTNEICNNSGQKVVILKGIGYYHVYSFHGKNVWDVEHHMEISRKRGAPRKALLAHRQRICKTLDYLKLDNVVDVVGVDGLAFTWRQNDN